MVLPGVADGVGCTSWLPRRFCLGFIVYRFIIDGIITLPIALYGLAIFPDVPATTKAFYLTQEVQHVHNEITQVF